MSSGTFISSIKLSHKSEREDAQNYNYIIEVPVIILSLPTVPPHPADVGTHPTLSSWSGLCVSMILGIEPLTPNRTKVRFQTKRDTGFTPCADGRGSLPGRVCSSDLPVQVNQGQRNPGRGPHLFKKG